jgi:hypothetical protein
MPQLAPFDTYPPALQNHLNDRLHRRVPAAGKKRARQFWKASREVPTAKWYHDFGNFVVCGKGTRLSTYLGPDEMDEIEGYALLCWRNNKNSPEKLKKCWRDRGAVSKKKAP